MSPSVEPFNEIKYMALMDGLECSEMLYSQLERTLRIDSEFYQKKYLKMQKKMASLPHKPLTDFVNVSDGNHMSISKFFVKEGIPYYRGQDIKYFFIENSQPICIQKNAFMVPNMKRSHLKKGDVLLSIVGTIGSIALVYSNREATCSCKLAILRPKDNVKAEVIAVFLKSIFGQMQINRFIRGAVQKGLLLEDADQLMLPLIDEELSCVIQKTVIEAYDLEQKSSTLYLSAMDVINKLLHIDIVEASKQSTYCKTLSNSFRLTGRLDAEYYQPKYDELFNQLSKFKTKRLGGENGIVSMQKSIEPGSDAYQDKGIPFVRVSDVSKFEISKPEIHLSEENIQNVSELYPKKDTILFSKDGSVGIAYKIDKDEKMITSGALLHLTVRNVSEVLPDYLTLVLNSPIVQLQAERDSNGAIIQHWKPSEIENVVIPILDINIQKEIASKVQESFALRHRSEQLLEFAKQAVEMAIEQDGKIALEWLKRRGGE